MIFYITLFIVSSLLLFWAGNFLSGAFLRIARILGWKEFVVSFFILSFAASAPEFLIGLSSALHRIPDLAFGDIVGANIIHFTLAVSLCALFLKDGIAVESRTVQAGSLFAVIATILPFLLMWDGVLDRIDGLLLILLFAYYSAWLFSRRERFSKIYNGEKHKKLCWENINIFFKDLGLVLGGIVLLLVSAEGIIRSAKFFAGSFDLSLGLVGVLIVGAGTALPESYFSVVLARRDQGWMILGNLMGCTAVTATMVLGLIALIHPVRIDNPSPFVIGRFFLVAAAVFFLLFLRNDRRISRQEAFFLLMLYAAFVLVEIFFV